MVSSSDLSAFRAYRFESGAAGAPPLGKIATLSIGDLSDGDTVIRVAYVGLNYKDALAFAGKNRIIRQYPRIGGIEFVGHVVESSKPELFVGAPVIVHGFGVGVDHDGGFSEYARVSSDWVSLLPQGLTLLDVATLGVAGYTAALSVHWLESCGLVPESGEVAVTGATGGVGGIAVDILATRGYTVCAISGKPAFADYLRSLGAARVIGYPDTKVIKPLESGRWAGAVDSVGGQTLAWLLSTTRREGVVAAYGNVEGAALNTSVLPFILRGVKLMGINASGPVQLRQVIWEKLASDYRPRHLGEIRRMAHIEDIPESLRSMLDRKTVGRIVIEM